MILILQGVKKLKSGPNKSTLGIKIFLDGGDLVTMKNAWKSGSISGFTSNPSLMKEIGVCDYLEFAKNVVSQFPNVPVSFEVLSDDKESMEEEASILSSLSDDVYVKIPVVNTMGKSNLECIRNLSNQKIKLNVTAVFTEGQMGSTVYALNPNVPSIISVFAGRIADTGMDPEKIIGGSTAYHLKDRENIELLWASTREVFNIFQAIRCGCDIITLDKSIYDKMKLIGKPLLEFSQETVQMFCRDAEGFSLKNE